MNITAFLQNLTQLRSSKRWPSKVLTINLYFCNIENRCVATLRLQDSLKFLRNGNFEIQDFKDYHNLIKLGFLTNPPPLLDASESVEQAISLFSTGCEAVLFNFNKKLWNYFGHDDTASNVLNDGLHI